VTYSSNGRHRGKSGTKIAPRLQESREILDQAPPANIEAEKAILSSLLIDGKRMPEVLKELTGADDFHDPQYRRTFEAMSELHRSGRPIDCVHVQDVLIASGALGDVGVAAFLQAVFDDKPTADNARYYAKLVADKATLRRIRDAGEGFLRISADGGRRGIEAALSEMKTVFAGVAPECRKGDSKRFPIYSSADLSALEFDENAIIENALIEGQPGGFFGGSKMLKTTLALDAGISVASGTNFLGCDFFRVPRDRRVMIMSAESGLKALQGTARRIANARDLELAGLQNLLWSDRVPFLGNDVDPRLLGEQIKEHGVELLFLDPAYQMLDPRDSGNLFAQGIQLRRLLDVCRDAGCDFVLLHHTTRHASKQCEQPNLTDASWAGFSEFVGQWILVARRRPYIAGSGMHELWLVLGARGAHQASWVLDVNEHADEWGKPQGWAVTVKPASESQTGVDDNRMAKEARKAAAAQERNAKRLEDDKAAVLRLLERLPDGETKNQIRTGAHLSSHERTLAAVDALLEDGRIVPCEICKSGQKTPQVAYMLKVDG
jgi:hypothetical protein